MQSCSRSPGLWSALALALGVSALSTAAPARAAFNVGNPFGANTAVSMFVATAFDGWAVAQALFTIRQSDGACIVTALPSDGEAGLGQPGVISGGNANDTIYTWTDPNWSIFHCNGSGIYIRSYYNPGGHYLRLTGGSGNDRLFSHYDEKAAVEGGAGADTLVPRWNHFPVVFAEGGDGNDTIYIDGDWNEVYGGAGDDVLCERGGYVPYVDGGIGFDRMCGSAQDAVSINSYTCAPCGAPTPTP